MISPHRTARLAPLYLALVLGTSASCGTDERAPRRVILILVDGFRADMLTEENTPRMYALAKKGVRFDKHHSIFPCTTMTNAGAIATGSYPRKSSWWGEKLYAPTASGTNARGEAINFSQHVEVRDWATLKRIDNAYNGQLQTVPTLFRTARAAGLTTAILGKPGATFLQDMDFPDYFIDTDTAAPFAFAKELAARGYALPPLTPLAFPSPVDAGSMVPASSGMDAGMLLLPSDYVNPYAPVPPKLMMDGLTADPSNIDSRPSQVDAYAYFVKQFVEFILPEKRPDLSFLWLNEPDATMHTYGPGSPQYKVALRAVDEWVWRIVQKVRELRVEASTDIIVTSDHGATTVSGDLETFPLRLIKKETNAEGVVVGKPSEPHKEHGWSVSGQAMLVEPLRRAGFNVMNGRTCIYDPLMTGMKADGSLVYPTKSDDACAGRKYTSAGFLVEDTNGRLQEDAVLLMETAGGDFIFVPSHDRNLVLRLVRFLQERPEVGAIFAHSDYFRDGDVPGALSMDKIFLENPVRRRTPDIALSYWTDGQASVFGVSGIGYHNKPSPSGMRGDHGALARQDIDIVGFGLGPDFREGFVDEIPSANVDIAPTIAHLLGIEAFLNFEDPTFGKFVDGRILFEALKPGGQSKGRPASDYHVVSPLSFKSTRATGLKIRRPTSPDGSDVDPSKTSYSFELTITTVTPRGEHAYPYIEEARTVRD